MIDDLAPFPELALPELKPGSVWLVGAGPGDPGLLSLLALHALRQATVVVYDALVDERILAMARPGARLENAGKRGGRPSPKQADISLLLVELAQAGECVLRLKGGDPFVFGRGAEEARALVAAGIPFRVVPGITSGIGGLAYAGIPLTDRDTNSAVTFITGHSRDGVPPDGINWRALAEGSPVLVIYMGMKHLGAITERLIAAGRRADEPLAIVSRAATPHQLVVETTLGEAAEAARRENIPPPALVVLGEVVRLRATLDWLSRV